MQLCLYAQEQLVGHAQRRQGHFLWPVPRADHVFSRFTGESSVGESHLKSDPVNWGIRLRAKLSPTNVNIRTMIFFSSGIRYSRLVIPFLIIQSKVLLPPFLLVRKQPADIIHQCFIVYLWLIFFPSCFQAPKSPGTTRKDNIGKNTWIELLNLKTGSWIDTWDISAWFLVSF